MNTMIQEDQPAPLRLTDFARELSSLLEHLIVRSPFWSAEPMNVHIMLNPAAGGLSAPGLRAAALEEFGDAVRAFSSIPTVGGAAPWIRVHESQAPGGVFLCTQAVFDTEPGQEGIKGPFRNTLVLSFGGDGTHQEVLNGLYSRTNKSEGTVLCRVPMGTGNDSADVVDGRDLAGLLYAAPHLEGASLPAVRVRTNRGSEAIAGNIAGIGMDAYVVFLSEDYKKRLPGKAYKIAADLGVLNYRKTFNLQQMHVRVEKTGAPAKEYSLLPGIICFGAGGYRTYGRGLPVLPGEENICLIPMGSLFQNIALKKQLYEGKHVFDDRVQMESGDRMIVNYGGKLPMQLDGEVRWLEPEDFPVTLEMTGLGRKLIRSRSNAAVEQSRRIHSRR